MRLEVSYVVKAQPEHTYAAYTDFEAMPRWSKRLTSVRVAKREGDFVRLEIESVSSKGKPRKIDGLLRLTPPNRVESESETRFTRTKRTVDFEAAPDGAGTKVTATLEVRVKGLWAVALRPGARKDQAESAAFEELASFARYAEGAPLDSRPTQ